MVHSNKETLSVIWCDNGNTDGKFTEGLVYSLITGEVKFHNAIRVQGNQIARQRQAAFEMWNQVGTDWSLWVDSDIVLTKEVVKTLWDTADKMTRPVVSGVYFISKQMENSLMQPMPAIFDDGANEFEIKYHHPLPRNQVIKVDSAGLGLVLMHKSVIKALHEKFGEHEFMFAENSASGERFIGEDIAFFRKVKEAGVPVYANTSALVKHMKRFAFDDNYYNLYWAAIEGAERAKQNDITTASE